MKRWAIAVLLLTPLALVAAVWGGDDGTDADQALATCGEGAVVAAYDLDPQTGGWSRWFAGKPEASNLPPLSDKQGVLALGGTAAVGAAGAERVGAAQTAGQLRNCPPAGKWSIAVWGGPDGTDTGQAFATCGEGAVIAAYNLDPQTGGWSRWFAGRAEMSTLSTLDNMQGVIALGGAQAPATPTPSPTPTPTAIPTATPTPNLAPISLTFTSTRPPGSFTGTPFPTAKVYFFIVSGFDLDAARLELSVGLSGPSGSVPDDFHLWQWVEGAPSAIALFLFPVLPAGDYTVSITLPDGRTASATFTHAPG